MILLGLSVPSIATNSTYFFELDSESLDFLLSIDFFIFFSYFYIGLLCFVRGGERDPDFLSNASNMSLTFDRFFLGSQVLSFSDHPFHFTSYKV